MTMLIPIRDHNPYKRFPLVTVVVIAINVFVFLSVGAGEEAVFHYGSVPCDVLGRCAQVSAQLADAFPDRRPLFSLVTSMFMHGDLFHLGGNMLYLWVFGNNVEDRLGRVGYIAFYLGTGLVAAFAHFLIGNTESIIPVVGASGAVSGVLGAYVVLWPHARVVSLVPLGFFFFTTEVPAWFLIGFWFVVQVVLGLGSLGYSGAGGGVAFFAHIGGFAAGWLVARLFVPKRRRRPPSDWASW